jgi:hypothetical protein
MNQRIFITAATGVFIILVISACGGSSSTAAKPSVTSTSTTVTPGAIPSLPPQPFRVGDRVGLGVWQLRVVDATIGATTIVHIELTNESDKAKKAPDASLYELVDGANSIPTVTATVAEIPAQLSARQTVPGTLTFTSAGVPKIPYLHWTGKIPNSLSAYIALDASGEPQSSD